MFKQTVVTKIQFIGKGKQQISKLSGMTKYFQYRDGSVRRDAYFRATPEERAAGLGYPNGVSDYVKPDHRDVTWVDKGMGETHREITKRAVELAGRRTTARMWIIAPDPELMQHIPSARRMHVLQQVTEKTLEYLYDDNGWGRPEYSYVMHDKERRADGLQMLHTHIVTPGTYDAGDGVGRLDHVVRKAHIRNLHDITHEVFLEQMEHELGRTRTAEILRQRQEKLLDEKDPDRHQRQQHRERAEWRDTVTQFNDLWNLLEQERLSKKQKEQQKITRRQVQVERQDALRRYFQLQRREARAERDESYATVQAEWERKYTLWNSQHQDELQQVRTDELRRQQLQAKAQREAEREEIRSDHMDVLQKRWGWQQAHLLTFFGDKDLAEMAEGQREVSQPSVDMEL